jgi:hypothetical protein
LDGVPQLPFYFLITNAVRNNYGTPPSTLPLTVKVDYFRAYKKLD